MSPPLEPGSIAGVVLAGGGSTRMGRPKATLPWRGRTFCEAALRAIADAGCAPLLVVSGVHAEATGRAIPEDLDVTHLRNPTPERGQLSSLKLALAWLATRRDVGAALVSLIDHPGVRATTVERLRDAAQPDSIVVPIRGGRRGHPVVFGTDLFAELGTTPDDQGARAVVRRDPARVVEIEVDDPAIHMDVDTPSDLREAQTEAATPTAKNAGGGAHR